MVHLHHLQLNHMWNYLGDDAWNEDSAVLCARARAVNMEESRQSAEDQCSSLVFPNS